jgi:3alpha(or 20beta)-hydroxysteroid dehydrogenase
METLADRVVVVTGAGRGRGHEHALLAAAEGAAVVVNDNGCEADGTGADPAVAAAVVAAIEAAGGRAVADTGDVATMAGAEALLATALEAFGRVDGLVNNAGILRFNTLLDTPLAEFMQVLQVNQVGCFLGMKTVGPVLSDGGTIVNTASYTGVTGMAGVGAYAASKHAVLGLTRVAALELAPRGIRVNAMCPGAVDTAMSNPAVLDPSADGEEASRGLDRFYRKLVPLGRIGRPQEVAALALFLTSADSSYITGQPFVIDGGWLAGVSVI